MLGKWTVERRSGRGNDQPRPKIETDDESKARHVYSLEALGLRQGSVRLYNPAGEIVERCWAPRLRSRW